MTTAMRDELVAAIENDQIDNAAEYAETFARRHGLNPVSVRSTISRLRRDLGKLTRGERAETPSSAIVVNAITMLRTGEASDARFTRLAAAALMRCEADETFRRAVKAQRRELERIQQSLETLRETTAELLPEERDDFARLWKLD